MLGGPNQPWKLILSPAPFFSILNKNGDVLYRRPKNPPKNPSNGVFLQLNNIGSLRLYDSKYLMLWDSNSDFW